MRARYGRLYSVIGAAAVAGQMYIDDKRLDRDAVNNAPRRSYRRRQATRTAGRPLAIEKDGATWCRAPPHSMGRLASSCVPDFNPLITDLVWICHEEPVVTSHGGALAVRESQRALRGRGTRWPRIDSHGRIVGFLLR
jgi:hypothetical protein